MVKRLINLRNWNMWVINRCAELVVDISEGVNEAEARDAITEYIDRDLHEGGKMHDLFGRERKIGDPEAGDTVVNDIKDAPSDAKPDLRLRFVEDDDGEHVEVEFVREAPSAEPLTAEELSDLLYSQLADDAPASIQSGAQKTTTEFVVFPFDSPPLSVKVAPAPE